MKIKNALFNLICFLGSSIFRLKPGKQFEPKAVRKILISRECCLGDILMSTPMVRTLRKHFPDAQIDYMVGSWARAMIEDNPYVSDVLDYVCVRDFFNKATWLKLSELRRKRYDLVVVGDVGFTPILTAFLTGASYRAGFDANQRGFLLTHKVPRSADDKWHETEAYLEIIRSLGFKTETPKMDLFLPERDLRYAEDLFRQNGLDKNKLIICLFPGGGINPGTIMFSKRWGEKKYAQLADRLINDYQAQILFLGGPSDVGVVRRVIRQMKGPSISVAGQTSIKQTAALIKLSNMFIGNDCGPMHIAAAVGTPAISIFGPTDPNKVAPKGDSYLVVNADIDCSPCYRQIIGDFPDCKTIECMEKIRVEDVMAGVDKLLNRRGRL